MPAWRKNFIEIWQTEQNLLNLLHPFIPLEVMRHLNPLQVEFIDEIRRVGKSAEVIAQKISRIQKWITVIAVIVYGALSWVIFNYIHNVYLSVFASVCLIGFSIPSAVHFTKKQICRLIPTKIDINPALDYRGYWKYTTEFEVFPNLASPLMTEYHRRILSDYFDGKIEKGVSEWTLTDTYELKVKAAEGQLEEKISMTWKTDPIVFDDRKVRWLFETKINWNDNRVTLPNTVYGREEYEVKMWDKEGRPRLLKGTLLGCIQPENQYIVRAKSTFERISREEFSKRKERISKEVCMIKKKHRNNPHSRDSKQTA